MSTTTLNKLTKVKVRLNPPLIVAYLSKGYTQEQIAEYCNVSASAVSQYISKHCDKLLPLLSSTDDADLYGALKARYVADLAQDRLIKHLPTATNKQLVALNMISGVHIDKYRLLSDKSTSTIAVDQLPTRKTDRDNRKRLLQDDLRKIKGDVIDV